MSLAKLHLGTSGWHYKQWINDFYPPKFKASEMLHWYAQHFATVEINNSFYRLPSKEDFQRWAQTVTSDFCFSVKASQYITHRKRLHDAQGAMEHFLDNAQSLGKKLGPILFQFPPNWHLNVERLETFLSKLPGQHRYVVEFRDLSWYVPKVYTVLKQYRVALCLHDWRALQWPVAFTTDFTYVRFHGPLGTYSDGYSNASLRKWARNVNQWRANLKNIFLYFNNDLQGHAIRDANTLRRLMHENPKLNAA
ncbi:MAG TPA: DUF72 domain-containing protein [Terriglobales bacterium]|jgi:uncharacterized protein YecE (DUF72 family)